MAEASAGWSRGEGPVPAWSKKQKDVKPLRDSAQASTTDKPNPTAMTSPTGRTEPITHPGRRVALPLRLPRKILEATVNGGRFWRDSKRPVLGMDIEPRHGPKLVADNTKMPFRDLQLRRGRILPFRLAPVCGRSLCQWAATFFGRHQPGCQGLEALQSRSAAGLQRPPFILTGAGVFKNSDEGFLTITLDPIQCEVKLTDETDGGKPVHVPVTKSNIGLSLQSEEGKSKNDWIFYRAISTAASP